MTFYGGLGIDIKVASGYDTCVLTVNEEVVGLKSTYAMGFVDRLKGKMLSSQTAIVELIDRVAYLVTLPILYSKGGRVGNNTMQQIGYPLNSIQGMLDISIAKPEIRAHYHPQDRECSTLEHAIAIGALEIVFVLHGSGVMALRYKDAIKAVRIGSFNIEGKRGYSGLIIEGGVDHQIVDVRGRIHIQEPQTEKFNCQKVAIPSDPILWDRLNMIYPSLKEESNQL